MKFENPFQDWAIGDLFETALPDFVLAFAFFTSIAYAILGKHFGRQRPAIAMSAALGFALAIGLVWWERKMDLSIRNLGPVAVGFAMIILAFIMYKAISQIGGSWAGAGIALGAAILIAKVLELNLLIDPDIVRTVMTVALIVGILAFLLHRHGHYPQLQYRRPNPAKIRHDMGDLYRDRRISKRLAKGLRNIRRESKSLHEHPEEAPDVILQLKRMLPVEGSLTERMAQLRAKAHKIRHGHIARLEETRQVLATLPASAKKKAAAELADRYNQIIGIDTRLERLDRAVAENEKRIRDLTGQAQRYTANYDYPQLHGCLKAAEKLQHHNSRLLKIITRTEAKLAAIVKEIAKQGRQVSGK